MPKMLRPAYEKLEDEDLETPTLSPRRSQWSRTELASLVTNLLLVLVVLYQTYRSLSAKQSPEQCTYLLSTTSPALAAVRYKEPAHYKAEFRQTNPWRAAPGVASEEVDKAWEAIEIGAGGIWVSEEEMQALKPTSSPERPLHKVPAEHGGGYLAMLESFHLLHCLNILRQGLFFNYDRYKHLDEGVHEENLYTHFDHCVDMLRTSIMCAADVTPALWYDPLDEPRRRDPLPDWSSMHTCRDFDAILDWNKNGPRSIRWRDVGTNPSYNASAEGADPPWSVEGEDDGRKLQHHHGG